MNDASHKAQGFLPVYAIGLMSGTSLDGVDAALLQTDGENNITFVGSEYHEYPADFHNKMHKLAQGDIPLTEVLRLEKQLTQHHIQAVQALLRKLNVSPQDVAVIGMHGQTIRHLPEEALTWQLGNPQQLAAALNIPVVSDFRRLDLAYGGQGAPLIPLYHEALCAGQQKPVGILNIGGVANLTYLGADGAVVATDTGPGMGLIDAWAKTHLGTPCDEDGKLASKGTADTSRVEKWFSDIPFFLRDYPKAADRYEFEKANVGDLTAEDGAATLAAFTALAVAKSAAEFSTPVETLYVTGGGSQHPTVMAELKKHFKTVAPVEDLNWRSDSMEAEGFAWLAVRRLRGLPLSAPTTTGVARPVCGGTLTV